MSSATPASLASAAETQSDVSSRSAPPPPIGVRFGEPLEGQRFRVAYYFDRIQRQGLLVGDDSISPSQVTTSGPYDLAPDSLEVTIHTVQLAYAPHPRATIVVEVPFVMKSLVTLDDAGGRSHEQTRGVGDVVIALVVPFIKKGHESSHVHIGFDIPTGSIRRGGDDNRLPFDSQIGNGTFDLEWGWTYRGEMRWLSWGGQAIGRHPIATNGLDYREGSRFEVSVWGAARLLEGLSASLRFGWQKQNNTHVAKGDFLGGPIVDLSDDPKRRGGYRLVLGPGLSFELPYLEGQRIAIEVGVPVYQNLDGPQLEQDWSIKAGWQWGF